ncbi:MAG: rod shape-determining protein MreD [Candidatus Eisenbacteria bacterium]|nr:rod shape-determining protein MreD [Candidatus Latescibacterota bacterium]MBD3303331.1 rod shape-determining protein MreD [Candidatus Eisenbacteria bacterium]
MVLFLVRLLLTTWAILAFRLVLGPKIAIAGVQPDLGAAFVFLLTLARGPTYGIIGGLVLGLLVDVDHPDALGLSSLAWCTLAYVTARASNAVDLGDRILAAGMLTVVVLLAESIRALALSGFQPATFLSIWVRWSLPTAVYTGIAVPILIACLRGVLGTRRWLDAGS